MMPGNATRPPSPSSSSACSTWPSTPTTARSTASRWAIRRSASSPPASAYGYTREALPGASYLKLGLTYPLPEEADRQSSAPWWTSSTSWRSSTPSSRKPSGCMGIKMIGGKDLIPLLGEISRRRSPVAGQAGVPGVDPDCRRFGRRPRVCPAGRPRSARAARTPPACSSSPCSRSSRVRERRHRLLHPGRAASRSTRCTPASAWAPASAWRTACEKALEQGRRSPIPRRWRCIGDTTFFHSGITGPDGRGLQQRQRPLIILDNRPRP